MVAEVGLEPTRSCDQRILSPLWLPLHHSAISFNVQKFGIKVKSINEL